MNSETIPSLLESTAEKSTEQDSKAEKQRMEHNNKPQEAQKDVFSPVYGELHPTVRRNLCQRIRDDQLNSVSSKLS